MRKREVVDSGREEAVAFKLLFNQRMQLNEHLAEWIENSGVPKNANGDIGLPVSPLAGTTYMLLHKDTTFLRKIRRPDGSYDPESMKRLLSLEPWMVFDLLSAHPEYASQLPVQILETGKMH